LIKLVLMGRRGVQGFHLLWGRVKAMLKGSVLSVMNRTLPLVY